jgi:hypothetical protein
MAILPQSRPDGQAVLTAMLMHGNSTLATSTALLQLHKTAALLLQHPTAATAIVAYDLQATTAASPPQATATR